MGGQLQRHLLLATVAGEGMLLDAAAIAGRYLQRVVGAERIEDDDLVGPANALEAGAEGRLVIEGGDEDRELCHGGWGKRFEPGRVRDSGTVYPTTPRHHGPPRGRTANDAK